MKGFAATITALFLASIPVAAEEPTGCPTELVNFWKTFAMHTQNPDAIPGFLLTNECFRATTSPEFYEIALKRLDNPENPNYVRQLYAELTWTNGYIYE